MAETNSQETPISEPITRRELLSTIGLYGGLTLLFLGAGDSVLNIMGEKNIERDQNLDEATKVAKVNENHAYVLRDIGSMLAGSALFGAAFVSDMQAISAEEKREDEKTRIRDSQT